MAVAALFAAGCGGDGGTTASKGGVPLSKAVFIKRADAICEKADVVKEEKAVAYREEHEAELNKLSPVAAEEQIILAVALPSIERQIEDISALGALAGEERQVEKILAGFEAAAREARRNPYLIEGEYWENPFHDADLAARDYGFNVCSNLT